MAYNEQDKFEDTEDNPWTTVDLDGLKGDDDDNEEEEQDTEEQDQDSDGVEDSEDDSEGEEAKEEKSSKKSEKRKSRAQERIQQLVKEKKEAEAKAKEYAQKVKEMETSTVSTQKEGLKSQLNMIETQVETNKRLLKQAREDGDYDTEMELQERLDDLRIDKRILEAKESKLKVQEKSGEEDGQAKEQIELPQEMQNWFSKNDWAIDPITSEEKQKVRYVRRISSSLLKAGFSESDPEFYEELDERLEKQFGSSDEDVLESNQDEDSSDDRDEKPAKRKKTAVSPAAGGSGSAPTTSSKKLPKPSAVDRETARKLNLPIDRYMKAKMRYEQRQKNEDTGWTNVL